MTELNSDFQVVIFDDAWANSEIMFNVLFSLIFMNITVTKSIKTFVGKDHTESEEARARFKRAQTFRETRRIDNPVQWWSWTEAMQL